MNDEETKKSIVSSESKQNTETRSSRCEGEHGGCWRTQGGELGAREKPGKAGQADYGRGLKAMLRSLQVL